MDKSLKNNVLNPKKLNSSKRAQSISINTIVIAAIALFVMVLLIVIFVGNITGFRKSADACESNGGICIFRDEISERCSGDYDRVRTDYNCYNLKREIDEDKVCCVRT